MCVQLGWCVSVTITVIKHNDQKQFRKKRVYLAYTFKSLFFIKESQDRNSRGAGTWRQELVMQRPWRVLLTVAHHGLFSLLSYRAQDLGPRDGTTLNRLGPAPSITN